MADRFECDSRGLDDPDFDGEGPSRNACEKCGGCVSGCPHNAKNSLDKNYLYLAEKTGLKVMTETIADRISRLPEGGYAVELRCTYTGKLEGSVLPSFIAEANQAAKALASVSGGQPMNFITECLLGVSNTAHILGGCPMGNSIEERVIDTRHEIYGYPGLFVCDGSSIPENLGVNPSLTTTAMADRFAALQGRPGSAYTGQGASSELEVMGTGS